MRQDQNTTAGSYRLFSRATAQAIQQFAGCEGSPVTVITGATVHPVSRAPIENGVVLIENGIIKAGAKLVNAISNSVVSSKTRSSSGAANSAAPPTHKAS